MVLQLQKEQPTEQRCLSRASIDRWEGAGKPQRARPVTAPCGNSTLGSFRISERSVNPPFSSFEQSQI